MNVKTLIDLLQAEDPDALILIEDRGDFELRVFPFNGTDIVLCPK